MMLLRRSLLLLSLLAFLGTGALAAERNSLGTQPKPAADSGSSTGRVIVKYRSNASVLSEGSSSSGPQTASAMGKRLGLSLSNGRALSSSSQVLRTSGMSSQRLAESLASDSDVEWAVVDGRRFATTAPNDPLYADNQSNTTPVAGQWYLRATTSTIKASIDVETAWAVTEGNSSLVVAVLDTGVVKTHPDLSSRLLSGYDFVSDSSVANDGDGRDSDPSDPGDWITSSEDASGTFEGCGVSDSSWHGTRTASLVGAATNNSVGMAGVAPNVMVLPVRVLGKCGGYDSDIIAAMRWAAGFSVSGVSTNSNPASVINLSLGASGSCSAAYEEVMTELTEANVVVVAAAGNDGLAVSTPANCSGVVAVAGVRHTGTKVGYSNLGPEVIVSAPAGNCVNSTGTCVYPIITAGDSGTTSPVSSNYSDGDNYSIGTSFSTPLVTGTVALMLSANSTLTPGEVISLLKSSARTFPSTGADSGVSSCKAPSGTAQDSECYCTTTTCGAGLLDAGAAVSAAQSQQDTTPTAVITSSASLVLVGETVTLDGSGSTVVSGRSLSSYLWEISSGSGSASFSTATNLSSVSLLATAEGTVTVKLTVTDSAGQTASQSSSFSVAAGRPTASFTVSNSTPVAGDSVTLDGSASSAQGSASISSYLWEITEGSSLASISGSATGSSATLATTAAGSVTVRLTVTDSNNYTGTSSQTLTISAASSMTTVDDDDDTTSSGGGALSPLWALALLAACGLLRRAGSARR